MNMDVIDADGLKKYGLIYLAAPYSSFVDGIERAFELACQTAGELIQQGVRCYSPIAHTHPIATHAQLNHFDYTIWLPFDEAIMSRCDAMCIVPLEGWDESKGIKHEVEFFDRLGKPVFLLK
jgi:hypothetical protein